MHGVGVLAPLGEPVGVQGELLLQACDDLGVLVEQDGAVSGLEPAESLLGRGPGLGGGNGLDGGLDDVAPQLLVVGPQEHDDAGGLRVEAGRHVEDGLLDDLLDLGVGDGRFGRELVDGATGLDGVEEGA